MSDDADRTPLVVVAEWRVRPGSLGEVLALLSDLEAASRAEPGCEAFEGFCARSDPRRIILVERYADRHAFAEHRASEHFRTIMTERVAPLLDGREVHAHVEVPLDAPARTGDHP